MTIKTINLAGKDWDIPQMAIKQNRIITPLIMQLMPIFAQEGKEAFISIGKEHYDALLEIIYVALNKANPSLTRNEFEDLVITLPEMVTAFTAIVEQSGLFVKGESTGEAQAGN